MKVVLLEDVKGLGKKLDVKEVPLGYVRNFLLPRKLVEPATEASLLRLKKLKDGMEEQKRVLKGKLKRDAEAIGKLSLEFPIKTGEKGEVFGSVSAKDIKAALRGKGFEDQKINLAHPIKSLGEHGVEVILGEGIKARLAVKVRSQP